MVKNVELETSGKQQNDVPTLESEKGNSLKSDGSQTKIQKVRCKWHKY